MRTYFEPEEAEEFESARDLLIRRCLAWADEHGLRADEAMLATALDARHRSRDGRLAHWDARQVRRFLLEWIPRHLAAEPDVLAGAPESLLTLLRYLAASGLRDPRSASLTELEAAVAEAAAEYPAALADPARQGIMKFWAQTALDHDIVLDNDRAAARFQRELDTGRIQVDADTLDSLLQAEFTGPGAHDERAFSQNPVALPPATELAAEATRSEVVRQLTALTGWVGAGGRPLTKTGNLRLADARELAALLGTGEQDLRVRSSAEMRRVSLLLAWAKKTHLVRVLKGRLVPVAKAAPLLRDAEALWRRAFEAVFELGTEICTPPAGWVRSSMFVTAFKELLPDVLNTMYSLPTPLPVARLQETVWLACQEYFLIDPEEDDFRQEIWRRDVERDLLVVFDVLADLGAVELSHGMPDELYSSDLRPGVLGGFGELTEDDLPLPPEARARLLERLAEPGPLVRLTPLGTRAVRERLLADGRDAPLVGSWPAPRRASCWG